MADQLEIEAQIVNILLKIEQEFRQYHELHSKELKLQRENVAKLWTLSQRYALLNHSAEQTSHRLGEFNGVLPEELLLAEYNDTYQQILSSIGTLKCAVDELRPSYDNFKHSFDQLNVELLTPFITGDAHHRPIAFFVEFVDDTVKYFQFNVISLVFHAEQLKPTDLPALDSFKKLLIPNEEFNDNLIIGLTYCKSLRPAARKQLSSGGNTPSQRPRTSISGQSNSGPTTPTSSKVR